MESKKTPIKLHKPFRGYTVNIRYMHGDADFYSGETYWLKNDFDLEVALKFFTTISGLEGHPFIYLSDIMNEYGSLERYEEHRDSDDTPLEKLFERALERGTMNKEQLLRFCELATELEIIKDACCCAFIYRCAKVDKITIQYYDGTNLYDVETEYNRKPEYDWQKGENDAGED